MVWSSSAGTAIIHIGGSLVASPTAADVSVSGRILAGDGTGIRGARVTMTATDGTVRSAVTNAFGYYRFGAVESGRNYVVNAAARGYSFSPRAVNVNDQLTAVDLIAAP